MCSTAQTDHRPLAVTMGCPAGIGPEILCRLFSRADTLQGGPAIVVGDPGMLRRAAEHLGLALEPVNWQPGDPVRPGTLPVFRTCPLDSRAVTWGRPDAATGRAMAGWIEAAVRLTRDGICSAVVTCPISKQSLREAGYPYPGHTEMLAALTHAPRVRMMMAGDRLRVVLVTIHEPLARVSGLLTADTVRDCIEMTAASLRRDFGVRTPRIAVAALNPHAGEGGLFGDEEGRIICPGMAAAADCGEVSGPWPPDTVFHRAVAGNYDAVIAMYHDQGLIPFKLLHFQDGVNVTLGLPIVRTSVDHGTAYDIAGQGKADPSSLAAAVRLARTMVANRAVAAVS